jgi:hypothetical protein
MILGGSFELYKGIRWSDFQFFNHVSLLGIERGVPENTIFFVQKSTEMNPLHAAADHRLTQAGFHLGDAHQRQLITYGLASIVKSNDNCQMSRHR